MKSTTELKQMLFVRLAELQHGGIKKSNPAVANDLAVELLLLYEILDEDVPEEYWEQIEAERL